MSDPGSSGSGVVGIGNAIVDVGQATGLYARMGSTVECSGGSAANSMAGLASLGGQATYIGKVRDDALGEVFRRDIHAAGGLMSATNRRPFGSSTRANSASAAS